MFMILNVIVNVSLIIYFYKCGGMLKSSRHRWSISWSGSTTGRDGRCSWCTGSPRSRRGRLGSRRRWCCPHRDEIIAAIPLWGSSNAPWLQCWVLDGQLQLQHLHPLMFHLKVHLPNSPTRPAIGPTAPAPRDPRTPSANRVAPCPARTGGKTNKIHKHGLENALDGFCLTCFVCLRMLSTSRSGICFDST